MRREAKKLSVNDFGSCLGIALITSVFVLLSRRQRRVSVCITGSSTTTIDLILAPDVGNGTSNALVEVEDINAVATEKTTRVTARARLPSCRRIVSYALLVLTAGRVGPLVSGVLAVFFSENDTSIRTADFGDQATSAISRDDARLDKSWLSIGATRSHPSTPDEATVMERRAVRRPVP